MVGGITNQFPLPTSYNRRKKNSIKCLLQILAFRDAMSALLKKLLAHMYKNFIAELQNL